MSQSSESIDRRHTLVANTGDAAPSRWKVSTRIIQMLQEDRAKRPANADPWRSRSSHVPRRERPKLVPPAIAAIDPSSERKSLTSDDRVPAWLISMIIHMVLVLLLALIGANVGLKGGADRISLDWTNPEKDGLSRITPSTIEPIPELANADSTTSNQTEPANSETDVNDQLTETQIQVVSPRSIDPSVSVFPTIDSVLGFNPSLSLETSFAGGRLGDRSGAGRAAAVESGATTGEAEDAMELALRWIANHQHNDGGWSFRLADEEGPCHGQCRNPILNVDDSPLPRTAATGLAMLAFMGAGNTHKQGLYSENVRRGIYYLRSQAREMSLGTDLQNGSMYGHGIATLALAEAYVLTSDPDLVDILKGTTFFCSGAQHTSGGWGYMPGSPPDITLTGWQIVALKTAEQRGIKIPTQVFPNAKKYVGTLADESGIRYGYKTPEPKLSTTAIGVLLQLYFGMLPGQTEIREALNWIASEGPSKTNVYYNYYAMLAMHHSRHQESMRFAKTIRDHLLVTQEKSGHERGSWHFEDHYGSVGGRLYTTAMCALILQTPYRYIPLYDR